MAQDINNVILVGRLTADATLRYATSGSAICTLSLAVNRRVKHGDQWQDEASFFDVTSFRAENLAKHLTKGTQIAVSGYLKQDRWERDGQKHSKVIVIADDLQLLGKPQERMQTECAAGLR